MKTLKNLLPVLGFAGILAGFTAASTSHCGNCGAVLPGFDSIQAQAVRGQWMAMLDDAKVDEAKKPADGIDCCPDDAAECDKNAKPAPKPETAKPAETNKEAHKKAPAK